MATAESTASRPPETLAERFWSLARGMEIQPHADNPVAVVRHVLAVLDALDAGKVGGDVTVSTLSFLALLRQQQLAGDLLYASPEQARGEQMDERSLVFSVGVLLFEKLTGRHPYGAEGNPSRIARIRRGEMASGVNFFPKVPARLRAVLVKAMGPFPEERYESLGQLRAQLEAYLEAERRHASGVQPLPGVDAGPSRVVRASTLAAPVKLGTTRALTEPDEEQRDVAVLELGGKRALRLPPAAWMGIGAAVATAAFFVLSSGGSTDGAMSASVSRAAGAGDTAEPADVDPTVTPMAAAADEQEQAVEPEVPAVFDADAGIAPVVAAARTCFGPDRLATGVQLGVSLLYNPAGGLSDRVYFADMESTTGPERRCLSAALVGLSAGAPPEQRTVVIYSLWLSAGDTQARARVQSQP